MRKAVELTLPLSALVLIGLSFILLTFIWSTGALALNFAIFGLITLCFIAPLSNNVRVLNFWGQPINFHHVGLLLIGVAMLMVLLWPRADSDVSLAFYRNGDFVVADVARFVSHRIAKPLVYIGLLVTLITLPVNFFYRESWFRRLANSLTLFSLSQLLLNVVVVHGVLKPFFSRSRPRHIPEELLAGNFEHWWVIGTECLKNCSMPSGEASAGFACLAAALAWNRGKLASSLCFTMILGFTLGFLRISAGAHFASDVVMSAVFMLPLSYALWFAYDRALRRLNRGSKEV